MGGLFEGWHPVVLLVIALIVFGPGKLPETFGQMGRAVRQFRDEIDETKTRPAATTDKKALPRGR